MINIKSDRFPPEIQNALSTSESFGILCSSYSYQSIEDNLADTNTMLVVLVIVVVVMVLTAPSECCVNSCCQLCLAEQCDVCYKLNNNPVMCPCIGEITEPVRARHSGHLPALTSLV